MKKPAVLALFLAALSPAFAQFTLDFDTPGQFSTYFSSAQTGPFTQSASGGLNNSGALDLSGLTGGATAQQIVTFNHGFSSHLSSWSASIYYYGNAQQFWQFGVVTAAAPELVEAFAFANGNYLPAIWLESGNRDGGAFAVGSYDGFSEVAYDTVIVSGGLPTSAEWYNYTINVTYTGGSNYAITGTLMQSDASGGLGSLLATSSLSIENSGLAAADTVYLYLNLYDGVALDNFVTTTYAAPIPEPSTYAALVGVLALGAAAWRRRIAARR